MMSGSALSNLSSAVIDDCRSGLDADALRLAIVPRLRRVVPIDALWWACADPQTLLFTRSHREELPESSGPYFVENEYLTSWRTSTCTTTSTSGLSLRSILLALPR